MKIWKFLLLGAVSGVPYSVNCTPLMNRAEEATFPFLVSGRAAREFPKSAGYLESIEAFPDPHSCLLVSERGKQFPDSSLIDWQSMKSTTDIDVCVFRILTAIKDFELGRSWLIQQGFEVTAPQSYGANLNIAGKSSKTWTTYAAVIDKYKLNEMTDFDLSLLQLRALRGASMQITIDKSGLPQSTRLSLSFE